MRWRADLRFLGALLATNLRASYALRGAFWLSVAFMFVNDAVWMALWWVFFARFPSIAGWTLPDMMTLHGLAALAFGFAAVFTGGAAVLAQKIVEGEIDVYLVRPKDALVHLLGTRSAVSGWGDIAYGLVILGVARGGDARWILGGTVASVAGAAVYVSVGVIAGSAAFWLGPVQPLARQVTEFLVTFSCYPDALYSGSLRFLLFTVLPAGLVTWMPAALLRDFSWGGLGLVVGGTLALAAVARLVWRVGLRRYESGNRLGVGP